MGRGDYQPTKWMPFRYYGLNIGSLATSRQTIEFRTFNETLEPANIQAWVELCQALVRTAFADKKVSHLPRMPLGSKPKFNLIQLTDTMPVSYISDRSWYILERLFDSTLWQPGVNQQVNHLTRQHDRAVPLNDLPAGLRPAVIKKEYVANIWNYGYREAIIEGPAQPRIVPNPDFEEAQDDPIEEEPR
jgi:hypothetical protein